jgi:hypothetical protein
LKYLRIENQDVEYIEGKLMNCLETHVLHEGYVKKNRITTATDGAGVVLDKSSGLVSGLKQKYPNLFTWHCLKYRPELLVYDAMKDVREIDCFKAFLCSQYSLHGQGPKQFRALKIACNELALQIV